MEPVDFEPVVRTIIAAGESYYAEFKSAWDYGTDGKVPRPLKEIARDIGEALVAFANSDGGDLLVGVEDTGAVTGVPYEGDKLGYLVQAPRRQVKDADLGATVREVPLDGHRVLLFRVPESSSPVVTAEGRCLWRKGATTEPVPPAEIDRRRRNPLGDSRYELAPVPAATLDDLAIPWDRLDRLPHLRRFTEGRQAVDLLRYWNLLEHRNGSILLRTAALLLFAREPLRWHPNNRLRLRRTAQAAEGYGRELRAREKELPGPIVDLARNAIRALSVGLQVEQRQELLFTTSQLLPGEAVEECVVNALVHRNYAIEGNAIEVVMFPDRVEFKSPGGLPEPLTVEDLRARKGVHRSRNPLIMRVMRDLGWARDQGEGMRRIFGAMTQVELNEPELEQLGDTFIVRLSTRSLYDDQTRAWIAAYGPYGLQPDERRYMVALRRVGGSLSVDRLARELSIGFDETERHLVDLERKGLVWDAPHSRTFNLVEPLVVPFERAFRSFQTAGVEVAKTTTLARTQVHALIGSEDERTVAAAVERLREAGVIVPSGKGQWRLGESFLEYARRRSSGSMTSPFSPA